MAEINPLQANVGLNLESVVTQIQPGQLTYALNAMVEGFDGQSVTYQNEQGNELCVTFPEGYKVVGVKNVTSINVVYYFLTNPLSGHSIIGYSTLNSCVFQTLLDDTFVGSDLLKFDIAHPIFKVEVKTTNCSTQLYWTDKLNPRRYIDLGNLPWKDVITLGVITPVPGQIDANKLLVQPNFKVPTIHCSAVNIGGNLVEGDYQFAIQYADVFGNGYTSFYSVTNKVRIFLDHKISPNFNETTNKSIDVTIGNIDTSGLYSYVNLAVIKTINDIASVELVDTFYINSNIHQHTYSGTEHSLANRKLTITDIFTKADYYDLAGDLTQVDNVLVWADLVKEDDISYQKIWNQTPVGWETWQIPYTESEGYHNGVNCANLQGYMRDEVYPLEGCFILKNGKETTRGHIPGRIATPFDWDMITNADASAATSTDVCNPAPESQYRWKVYNTGSITGTDPDYNPGDSCYKGPYQYGQMSYWQSAETYPNNSAVWGSLAGQPIRHHKFPDSTITHIYNQNGSATNDAYGTFEHAIYPIGFKVDINALRAAIQNSPDLTLEEKNDIVGFKIMRGDRVNNKSIIAKGLFYNCGKYTKDTSTYYYPNYPFNDTNPDPFISSVVVTDKSGANTTTRLHDFQLSRYTFHSPDTSFYRPFGIQGSFVKLETVEYGHAKAHFVPVKNNAGIKLRTVKDLEIALAGAVASIVGLKADYSFTTGTAATSTVGIAPSFNAENFFPSFNNVLEIVDKLIPYTNYGWQYNAVGYYGNYTPVPDLGNKIRGIEFGGYLNSGLQGTFGDDHAINNTDRESSVYISTVGTLPLAGNDNSRVTASQIGLCSTSSVFFRDIYSYYGAIKRYLPGQWGEMFSYQPVDTGFYTPFKDVNDNLIVKVNTIFGGDIFINRFALKRKHSFFLKKTVGYADGTDVDYDKQGNVGYPIWYYSTSNNVSSIDNTTINNAVTNFTNSLDNWVLSILLGGIPILVTAIILLIDLIKDGILTSLGIKVTNLECYDGSGLYEKGQTYLYAYGIPYYFCESEVNVDMRQATNDLEGNFYPQVSTDIPDDWLQEINVPIIFDNTYVYNKTYSKQNKETFFPILRPDWTPDNPCFVNFNNRAIWSDKSTTEEVKNNWLVYKPANTKDLPKGYGKLQNIDNLANNQILVRFENKTQIYNALTTLQVSAGPAAYVGNIDMFGAPPIDLSSTDIGNVGTQNSLLLKTDSGTIFVDAKRGEIALLQGTQVSNLEDKGVAKWMYQNLPFNILEYFPTINTDNAFNGIGLTGTYDPYFSRILITKKDYIPLRDDIKWDGTNFYLGTDIPSTTTTTVILGTDTCCPEGYVYNGGPEGDCRKGIDPVLYADFVPCPDVTITTTDAGYEDKTIVYVTDPEMFCDKSWTISYSFKTNAWVSFHSYIPDYYITFYSHFQSGKNALESTWDHDFAITTFNNFYGTICPYILEYPYAYKIPDEILQNVKDYTTVRKYLDYLTFYEPDVTIYFNKAVIYNGQQCTGILNLVPKPLNNLAAYLTYPKYNTDSKDIIVTKSDNFYNYNTFWDVVVDKSVPIWITGCDMNKEDKDLNQSNMNYGKKDFRKAQIRAKDVYIRHILDDKDDVRLISKFVLSPTVQSYK